MDYNDYQQFLLYTHTRKKIQKPLLNRSILCCFLFKQSTHQNTLIYETLNRNSMQLSPLTVEILFGLALPAAISCHCCYCWRRRKLARSFTTYAFI